MDKSPEEVLTLEQKILDLIGNPSFSSRECEKKLFSVLGHKMFELIKLILKNRFTVFYGTQLSRAQSSTEKDQLIDQMERNPVSRGLLAQLSVQVEAKTALSLNEVGDQLK